VLLPAEGKSTFAVVDVLVSARAATVALASAFVALQMHIRAAGAGVENVTVQLSTSVPMFGVVKAARELVPFPAPAVVPTRLFTPTPKAAKRVLEFFTTQISNDHTRKA